MKNLLLALLMTGGLGIPTAAPALADGTAAKPPLFSSRDVFELEYASDPRISPDGQRIVYVRRANDIMTDRTRGNLWIVDSDGTNHRPLLSGRASYSSPRWSPDGRRLAYISAAEGSPQLYVRWMDTGATALVTNLTEPPRDIAFSPDGKWLAFVMPVKAPRQPLAKAMKKPKGAKWADPVKLIDTVIYRFDGRGFLEPAFNHVFVVPADGGSPRRITSGEFNHAGPLSWSGDSKKVLFSANRHPDWQYETIESDIFAADIDSGKLTQITSLPGAERNPTLSPDGKKIAWIALEDTALAYRTARLVVADADGANPKILTAGFDRSVADIHWKADGKALYFRYDDKAVRKIGQVTLKGRITTLASGIGGTSIGRPYLSGGYTANGRGALAFTAGTSSRPADVHSLIGGKARRLTDLNGDLLEGRNLGQVHEIGYKSSLDGTPVQGWYLTPPDFDPAKKYPLVLEIHGGPHAAYGAGFSAEMQLFAAKGYVVFYDNYRGSASYGKKFALLLQYKYASPDDFADHMSGVDAMIEKGFIDPDNLFVTGGSAGGIGAAYAIGLTTRFRAAAVIKPVINWISKTLTGDIYTYQIRHQFPGPPWEEFAHYWKRSPLSLVGHVTTPTLLMTGEEDYRTPISETEQFYQALKLRRIDTVMIRVPGSGHGIAGRPSRLIAKVDNILAWFDKYRSGAP